MAKENEAPKFMGHELQVLKKSDGSEKLSLKKGEYEEILAGFGVTKEVLEVTHKADDAITAEAAKLLSERLLAANKGKSEDSKDYTPKTELVLGGGNNCMYFEYTPHKHHTSVDMKTHEKRESDKFGIFRVTKVCPIAQELRKEGGLIDTQAAKFEAEWKKVHKK